MNTSLLFSPLAIQGVSLRNRVVMPPMCQYASDECGQVKAYHLAHYGARSLGGVGLVIVEATAILADGRISLADLGLWADDQVAGLTRLAQAVSEHGAVPGIQLAHAGRKAGKGVQRRVAPTRLAFSAEMGLPEELSTEEIKDIVHAFAEAARRAVDAGFKVLEIHGAHGYLIHEFLSPLSNLRDDQYGGSAENRRRFLLEVVAACRASIPPEVVLAVRLSGSEYSDLGYSLGELGEVCHDLYQAGISLLHISSGGNLPAQPEVWPGYQLPFAQAVKKAVPLPVIGVGLLKSPDFAEFALREGYCDLVAVGRALLSDPHWAIKAAAALNAVLPVPAHMARGLQR
ncbi:MAG: NADPH dehydrogenase [Firmicutes bacterium]|nr:NADPH dehydrogenase [Dethiobacter sp.]MBS3887944.1 NADPH dehydrogenase [Bacillota bacterium]MBS4054216.1 NADPH dehydrogenase [Thermaerobacter sp.]